MSLLATVRLDDIKSGEEDENKIWADGRNICNLDLIKSDKKGIKSVCIKFINMDIAHKY
jgi:hypothetical protein